MDGLFDADDVLRAGSHVSVPSDRNELDLSSLGIELHFQGRALDRMTRHLFEELWPYIERNPAPADALAKMLRTKLRYAEYIAGPQEGGWFFQLPSASTDDPIWLMLNDLGTWTVMFSSDY